MQLTEHANQIRDVINYIKKFKGALCVIHIDDSIIESNLFPNHVHDIALIHEAGLKVIVVPGARSQINKILCDAKIDWTLKNDLRIADDRAMPLIKTAAFDVANLIMNHLAAENLTAVIGNWVKARSKGVIDGIDYGSSGEIDKLKVHAITQTLENGFVPIFPCIGWNDLGKPYNISSVELAQQIAIGLKAQKLFYILPDTQITRNEFAIPDSIATTKDGNIPAMTLSQLSQFLEAQSQVAIENDKICDCDRKFAIATAKRGICIKRATLTIQASKSLKPRIENSQVAIEKKRKLLKLFSLAKTACESGVDRIHILNGNIEGILPAEIFSAIGSGTMIYNSGYGDLRKMLLEDIPAVLSLMGPFIQKGILLPRTPEMLKSQLDDFIVYNVDGGIHACAALKKYSSQAEICAVAVDPAYSNIGVGPKMISFLLEKAKGQKIDSVFVLTTQTADWFQKLGFVPDSIDSVPPERKKLWTPERASKVYRIKF